MRALKLVRRIASWILVLALGIFGTRACSRLDGVFHKPEFIDTPIEVPGTGTAVAAGADYYEVDGNEPSFPPEAFITEASETYGELDALGRCTAAYCVLGPETMPTGERGDISGVKPTGWVNHEYPYVDQGWLYNRCHLVGWQLSGEDANPRNLVTGTRQFNVDGMLVFENLVADYIRETGHHVLYRVTPDFRDTELVCRGATMEAASVEDGEVRFHVYVPNVQDGVIIDYATGENWAA